MSLMPWGDAGDVPEWFVNCNTLSPGQKISLVLDIITVDTNEGILVGSLFPGRGLIRIVGFHGWEPTWFSITCLEATYEGIYKGIHQVRVQDECQILGHRILDREALFSVVETCSGIGVSSYGLMKAGFRIIAANDASGPLIEAYRGLHPDVSAIEGDIWDTKTLCDLHTAAPAAAVLAAGFSCQPFSAGGRQLGGRDSRSSSLPGVLRAALYLRKPLILLECVASARSNRFVRNQIESFCSQCGYVLAERILKLEDVWVSKRERWWAVLSVASMGVLKLQDFGRGNYPKCVLDVMPRQMDMPVESLEQLLVSLEEHQALLKYCDPKSMVLPTRSRCPTALHSWGSQVLPCPCGCRPTGFSDQTLAARGIYGVFLPAEGSHVIGDDAFQLIRHLHPSELAVLTWCPVPSAWPGSLRLALCGLGQQASPLQAAWIAGQLHQLIDRFLGITPVFDCCGALRELMVMIMDQSQALFGDSTSTVGSPSAELEPEIPVMPDVQRLVPANVLPQWISPTHVGGPMSFTLHFEDTQKQEIISISHPGVTVGNLRAAEVHINPLVQLWDVIDCATGLPLSNEAVVMQKSLLIRPAQCVYDEVLVESHDEPMDDAAGVEAGESQGIEAISPTIPFKICQEGVPDVGVEVGSDPLLALAPSQLLEVAPPSIGSVDVLKALRAQSMPGSLRRTLLHNQEFLWADDEIKWHLEDMISKSSQEGWILLDPLLASVALTQRMASVLVPWFRQVGSSASGIVSCVQVFGHWIPLIWTWNPSQLVCRSWDIQRDSPLNMSFLHEAIALAVGARSWSTHVVHRMFAVGDLCGVCAVRFVDSVLRGKMLPDSRDDAVALHETGRQRFLTAIAGDVCPRPWVWGGGLDPHAHQRLVDVMQQHGVPVDMVESRIALLVQALGIGPVQKVMIGTNPWRGLKSLANQARPPFQLVLASELADVVKMKAQQGGQQKKKKGTGKGPSPAPPALDPAKLKLEPGFFTHADGTALRVIGSSQIGPFAEGVTLVSSSAVEQILASGKLVSKFPLAAVVINADPDGLQTALTWSQLRVPVRCIVNDDPMLVHACVVQLGQGLVTQSSSTKVVVEDTQAACVKIAVYRDCISCHWSDFIGGPVRYILERILALQVCHSDEPSCACVKWHIGDSGVRDPVLDVWRRQWVSATFKMVPPDQAEVFIVNVRFSKDAERSVLSVSGENGIFVEPRSLDGRQPVHDWQVLWLHRTSLKEVMHVKQCNPNVVGVARLGSRFGVRVHVDHAVEVGAIVKPDTVILAAGARQHFEIGPIPFGFDRAAVQALCQRWKWQAKAVNPIRTLDGQVGTMWHVQSSADPPATVISTQHGEIVVAKMKQKGGNGGEKVVSTIGSNETLGLCALDSHAGNDDPWSNYRDPWSSSLRKVQMPVQLPGPEDAFRQAEARIEKAVLARLPQPKAECMEVDGDGERLAEVEQNAQAHAVKLQDMETQISQLVQHQQNMEAKIDANARKADVQVHQLQVSVSAQFDAQSSRMEDMFSKQMDQLSALLSKRARTE